MIACFGGFPPCWQVVWVSLGIGVFFWSILTYGGDDEL